MRYLLLNRLFVLVLLLTGCSEPEILLPRLDSEAVILAFGDSITHGTGTKPETSYPAILEELTGLEVINAGVPGEKTAEGLERLPRVLDNTEPDLLILCLGGNDMLKKNASPNKSAGISNRWSR